MNSKKCNYIIGMFIGIILIIVPIILNITFKKEFYHISSSSKKVSFSDVNTDITNCIKSSDKKIVDVFIIDCIRLQETGKNLKEKYSNYKDIIAELDISLISLEKILTFLNDFTKIVICDSSHCSNKYQNSIYDESINMCKCDNDNGYFVKEGVCIKCEKPNNVINGVCISNCPDGSFYNNGICVDVSSVSIFKNNVNKISEDIKKIYSSNIILYNNLKQKGEECLNSSDCMSDYCNKNVCEDKPDTIKKPIGGDCLNQYDCISDYCNNNVCEDKPATILKQIGEACGHSWDCESNWCENDKCTIHP